VKSVVGADYDKYTWTLSLADPGGKPGTKPTAVLKYTGDRTTVRVKRALVDAQHNHIDPSRNDPAHYEHYRPPTAPPRVQALADAVAACKPNQETRHPKVLEVFARSYALDDGDRAFLGDTSVNKPFWEQADAHLGPNPNKALRDKVANPNAIKSDLPHDLRTPELIQRYADSTDEDARKYLLAELKQRTAHVLIKVVTADDPAGDKIYVVLEHGGRTAQSAAQTMKANDAQEFTVPIGELAPIAGPIAVKAFNQGGSPKVALDWQAPYAARNNGYQPPYMVTIEFTY
jgi:hypothetical protein